jgi:1-aminocyclopropane-1-carboxylate deaminase/D-cysteine desulfhydrase-like pyridoxal-dependent ACC family enzyme
MDITSISYFDGWIAKREDEACVIDTDYPSGSKVRQYLRMSQAVQNAPMIVGCSAHSAMQIYVAAAAKQAGVMGIIYTAARKEPTAATVYAQRMGAEVVEVRPAYLSVMRSRAKARAAEFPAYVRWDVSAALQDAKEQCVNIPKETKRVIVPTGSGLTCAGVLAGLAELDEKNTITVLAVAVSDMASKENILATGNKLTPYPLPQFELVRAAGKYEDWVAAVLPDGTPLDPYYSAKALTYVESGDCLWLPGLRPLSAMPSKCQEKLTHLMACYHAHA